MRFRLGVGTGLAIGYYLGARAGRERYDEINEALGRLRRSDTFQEATDRVRTTAEEALDTARAAAEAKIDEARDLVESRLGDGHPAEGDQSSSR